MAEEPGAPAERAQSGGRIGEPFCVVVGLTETFIEEFPAQNITTMWGITIINMQWGKKNWSAEK